MSSKRLRSVRRRIVRCGTWRTKVNARKFDLARARTAHKMHQDRRRHRRDAQPEKWIKEPHTSYLSYLSYLSHETIWDL